MIQFYFYTVVSGYSAYANDTSGKYAPVNSITDIPMRNANGSTESLTDHHGHARNISITEPYNQQPYSDNPSYPIDAHMQPGAPTPHANQFNAGYEDPYYQDSSVHRPEQYQSHPGQS